ncbi:hypothetical protein HanXRQr2_Chr10g0429761 [Helianthus annuus]|uniref:Uncharacterized protein n=1 Tax=Helianthus annuus TaxID=4232 RepID=A0A9K3HW00_HELAN|nr:hypothetical protein HanXRQr2_Chr10g0429761 [Helianthus annuus]
MHTWQGPHQFFIQHDGYISKRIQKLLEASRTYRRWHQRCSSRQKDNTCHQ